MIIVYLRRAPGKRGWEGWESNSVEEEDHLFPPSRNELIDFPKYCIGNKSHLGNNVGKIVPAGIPIELYQSQSQKQRPKKHTIDNITAQTRDMFPLKWTSFVNSSIFIFLFFYHSILDLSCFPTKNISTNSLKTEHRAWLCEVQPRALWLFIDYASCLLTNSPHTWQLWPIHPITSVLFFHSMLHPSITNKVRLLLT